MACYHWDGNDHTYGNERAKSDTRSTSEIVSGSFAEYKWTFATPATVVAGDYISVDIPVSTGSSTNFFAHLSDYSTNTIAQEYRSGWSAKTKGLRFTAEYACS